MSELFKIDKGMPMPGPKGIQHGVTRRKGEQVGQRKPSEALDLSKDSRGRASVEGGMSEASPVPDKPFGKLGASLRIRLPEGFEVLSPRQVKINVIKPDRPRLTAKEISDRMNRVAVDSILQRFREDQRFFTEFMWNASLPAPPTRWQRLRYHIMRPLRRLRDAGRVLVGLADATEGDWP